MSDYEKNTFFYYLDRVKLTVSHCFRHLLNLHHFPYPCWYSKFETMVLIFCISLISLCHQLFMHVYCSEYYHVYPKCISFFSCTNYHKCPHWTSSLTSKCNYPLFLLLLCGGAPVSRVLLLQQKSKPAMAAGVFKRNQHSQPCLKNGATRMFEVLKVNISLWHTDLSHSRALCAGQGLHLRLWREGQWSGSGVGLEV